MEENKKVMPGVVFTDGREKTPNEKMYLILLTGEYVSNETKEYRDFDWKVGRQTTYDYLRDLIMNEEDFIIDIHASLVISESVNILDGISVYTFMKHFKELVVDETGFDIEEYNISDGVVFDDDSEA